MQQNYDFSLYLPNIIQKNHYFPVVSVASVVVKKKIQQGRVLIRVNPLNLWEKTNAHP